MQKWVWEDKKKKIDRAEFSVTVWKQTYQLYSDTCTPAQFSLISKVIAKYSALREREREGKAVVKEKDVKNRTYRES